MVNPQISVVFRGFHSDILINPYGFNFFAIFVSDLNSFPLQRSGSEYGLSEMDCLFLFLLLRFRSQNRSQRYLIYIGFLPKSSIFAIFFKKSLVNPQISTLFFRISLMNIVFSSNSILYLAGVSHFDTHFIFFWDFCVFNSTY